MCFLMKKIIVKKSEMNSVVVEVLAKANVVLYDRLHVRSCHSVVIVMAER